MGEVRRASGRARPRARVTGMPRHAAACRGAPGAPRNGCQLLAAGQHLGSVGGAAGAMDACIRAGLPLKDVSVPPHANLPLPYPLPHAMAKPCRAHVATYHEHCHDRAVTILMQSMAPT